MADMDSINTIAQLGFDPANAGPRWMRNVERTDDAGLGLAAIAISSLGDLVVSVGRFPWLGILITSTARRVSSFLIYLITQPLITRVVKLRKRTVTAYSEKSSDNRLNNFRRISRALAISSNVIANGLSRESILEMQPCSL